MGTPQGTEILTDPLGRPLPAVWDPTATSPKDGSAGYWREVRLADLSGAGALSAPGSNIPLTAVPVSPGAAVALAAGACQFGMLLQAHPNNGSGLVYWGRAGVTTSSGGVLAAGQGAWVPVLDSSGVVVVGDGPGLTVLGVRF